ncbi:hypothetical protein LguiA_025619 [Lonicera macranthoides]
MTTSKFTYDVFLSFKGTDTRKNFTDYLYRALKTIGVETFRDDDEIERGENIKFELQRAIRQSKMSIIVFSKNYTSSKECLEEVRTIFQHYKTSEHAILPVFYHVEPTELKKQAKNLPAGDRKDEWSAALKEIASIAGMHLKDQYEALFIEDVVEMVQGKLMPKAPTVDHHLVGIDSRVNKIVSWLKDGANDAGMLVICGMAGLGKTATAKFAFESNFKDFEASCFLENIREEYKNPGGLVHLQRKLLKKILRKEEKKIYDKDDGLRRIQYILKNRRVFLVLDDVDEPDQLDAILGVRNWFTLGSKIIITTRREGLLKAHEKFIVYKIENLNDDESLELFSLHAFGKKSPVADYLEQSKRFVHHCQGLPLALEVLGSSVSGKPLEVWESALRKLEVIPETKVLEKLKISYDSLENTHDQNLFLDIACFFVGKHKNDTVAILEGCDYYTELGIQNLIDRNLLSVEENKRLGMHQLLQDMGRQVVYEESQNPEEHTRLWRHKDSFNILRDQTGSVKVKGLILDMKMLKKNNIPATNIHSRPRFFWNPTYLAQTNPNDEFLETDAFKGMRNLRLLKLSYVKLFGTYHVFPKKLRWLYWRGFHLKSLPNEFLLENIVSLEIRNSSLEHVWKVTKVLQSLKILNLSHSIHLLETPNFSNIPNLEKLVLKNCLSLVEVDESLATLQRLIVLNLKDCKSLRKLPTNIGMVQSLEELIISGCSNLVGAVDELVKLKSLKVFHANYTNLNQLLSAAHEVEVAPSHALSFPNWVTKPNKNPKILSFVCLPSSLVTLSLASCNLSDDAFLNDFGSLPLLQNLFLGGNPIRSLPHFIRYLARLKRLDISSSPELQDVSWPSTTVEEFNVTECRKLKKITYETSVGPRSITHGACMSLNYVQKGFKIEQLRNVDSKVLKNLGFSNLKSIESVEVLIANGIVWSKKKCPIQILYESYIFSVCFPGREVPHWFSLKTTGSTISFIVPSFPHLKIRGLNLCLVYTFLGVDWIPFLVSVRIRNKTKGLERTYVPRCYGICDIDDGSMVWLSHWFCMFWGHLFQEGDQVEVSFYINIDPRMVTDGEIKKCGVEFLYFDAEDVEVGVAEYFKTLYHYWDSGMNIFELASK